MASEVEAPKPASGKIERLASERAKERIGSARWDLFVLVFAYATLATVLVLNAGEVELEVIAIVAIFGLALVWLIGWIRGRRQFKRFYDEELFDLERRCDVLGEGEDALFSLHELGEKPGLPDPAPAVEDDHPSTRLLPLLFKEAALFLPVDEGSNHD